MSVQRTQHSERRVGKGDARHDNFPVFRANFPNLKADSSPRGEVFLKKANRTVIKYP
jgi:hypothetical protein